MDRTLDKSLVICTILFIVILAVIQLSYNKNGSGLGKNKLEGFENMYSGLTNKSDTPWTIDKPTKLIITDIIRKIINMINQQISMSYYFTAYDQLTQEVLCPIRTRFTADFFMHEMRNLYTRRAIAIFVVNFKTKDVYVEHINFSNAYKNPSKDFMDYPAPELLLEDNNLLRNEYQIMGVNSSKIEFTILKDNEKNLKKVPTPAEFQSWILPMGIMAAYQNPQALFPSRRQGHCWDTNGVNVIQPQTNGKLGVNNSEMVRMPYPYFNPTTNLQRDWNTEYKWQFDLVDSVSPIGGGLGVARSP